MLKRINLYENVGISNVFKVLTANYLNQLKKKEANKEAVTDVKIYKQDGTHVEKTGDKTIEALDRTQNNSPLSWRENSRINFATSGNGNLPVVNIKCPQPNLKFNETKGGLFFDRYSKRKSNRNSKKDLIHRFRDASPMKNINIGL